MCLCVQRGEEAWIKRKRKKKEIIVKKKEIHTMKQINGGDFLIFMLGGGKGSQRQRRKARNRDQPRMESPQMSFTFFQGGERSRRWAIFPGL